MGESGRGDDLRRTGRDGPIVASIPEVRLPTRPRAHARRSAGRTRPKKRRGDAIGGDRPGTKRQSGVLVAPGLPEEVSTRIADDLAEDLREAYGALGWRTEFVERPARGSAGRDDRQLVEAARRALLRAGLGLRRRRLPTSHYGTAAARSRVTPAARTASPSSRRRRIGPRHLKRRLRRGSFGEMAGELGGTGALVA